MNTSMINFFTDLVSNGIKAGDLSFAQTVLNLYEYVEDGNIDNKNLNIGIIADKDVKEQSVEDKLEKLISGIPPHDKHYDNRLRELRIENFRTFPKSVPSYGLVLEVSGKPYSVFLVGANGTGKSSLFDAIEQCYTGHVSKLSELASKKNEYFLHYMFKPDVKPLVTIETVDELQQGELGDDALSFFISDTDLNDIEQFTDNLSDFILEQLGYSQLKSVENALVHLEENKQAEVTNLLKIPLDNVAIMKRIIKMVLYNKGRNDMLSESARFSDYTAIKNAVDDGDNSHKYFKSLWRSLKSKSSHTDSDKNRFIITESVKSITPTEDDADKKIKELASTYKVLHDYLNAFIEKGEEAKKELSDMLKILEPYESEGNLPDTKTEQKRIVDILNKILTAFSSKRTETIKQYYNSSKAFVEETMNKISSPFQDEFHMDIDEDNGDLFIRIDNKRSGTHDIRPIDYLNTFRFRMFEVSIKLSLAFLKMKVLDRALPVVIDDVFNSNDFANGLSLDRFVYRIYKTYEEQVGFQESLQVILLTHDELVQSAFKKGAYAVSYKDLMKEAISSKKDVPLKSPSDSVICGRLFPYYALDCKVKSSNKSICCLYIQN